MTREMAENKVETTKARKPFTRRDFVKLAGVAAAVAVLGGCSDKESPKSPVPTGTPKDWETPTVVAPSKTFPKTATGTATASKMETPTPTALPGTEREAGETRITFPDGSEVTVPDSEMEKRMHTGQGDILQIWDETNTKILYAYDKENKVWVKASDILQPDWKDPKQFIQIKTWDDLIELTRLEKMVLPPFPEDTYFPPLDKIFIDYGNPKYKTAEYVNTHDIYSGFSVRHPLGIFKDHDKLPFKYVNYIHLDRGEDRDYSVYILTEQFYNPQDGTFSLLHFAFLDESDKIVTERYKDWGLRRIQEAQENLLTNFAYLMPKYYLDRYISDRQYRDSFLKNANLAVGADGEIPYIRKLVREWLTTGKIPEELETLTLRVDSAVYDEYKSH
jgi:hypothetical protein